MKIALSSQRDLLLLLLLLWARVWMRMWMRVGVLVWVWVFHLNCRWRRWW